MGATLNQSSNATLLPVRLQWAAGSYDGSALLDFGAEESFLDAHSFTNSRSPPPRSTTRFRSVHSMDNHFLTSPIPLHLSPSSHRATTRRLEHFLSLTHLWPRWYWVTPGLLGTTPESNWGQNSVSEWSERCYASCLVSACSPVSCVSLQDEAVNLSNVPEEYLDLKEVFSKSRAASLPPHRPYDCAIDLVPGTSPPKGRLYSLSVPEREAMEKYISDSLAAGLIRPSSSPAGAGFFFVGKKDGSCDLALIIEG